jgi:hypothetical protein
VPWLAHDTAESPLKEVTALWSAVEASVQDEPFQTPTAPSGLVPLPPTAMHHESPAVHHDEWMKYPGRLPEDDSFVQVLPLLVVTAADGKPPVTMQVLALVQ